ncbi:MAG TPA: O-antigen ligase family protein [Baekduia sp.]|nr:O-antigen ligase family protein [Baekduia sp.]
MAAVGAGSSRLGSGLATAGAVAGAGLVAAVAAGAPPDPTPVVGLFAAAGLLAFAVWRPLAVVALGVLVVPFEGWVPGPAGPSQLVLAAAAFGWVVRWLLSPPLRLPGHPALLAFLALVAVNAAGLLFAPERSVVFGQVFTWGTLLVVAVALASAAGQPAIRDVALACAVAGGIAGVRAIVDPQPLTGVVFGGGEVERATAGLGSPNALGVFFVLVIPLQLVLTILPGPTWQRGLAALCAALSLVGMTLAVSRGAFAGLAVALLLLALWAPFRRIALAAVPVLAAIAIIGNPVSMVDTSDVVTRLSEVESTAASNPRIALWEATPDMIADHPLFGVGALEFGYYAASYGILSSQGTPNHAHSMPLTIAAELGLLGLAAFLAFVVGVGGALTRAARRAAPEGRGLAFGLAAGLSGFVVSGMVDYVLGSAPIAAAVFVLSGLGVALALGTPRAAAPTGMMPGR